MRIRDAVVLGVMQGQETEVHAVLLLAKGAQSDVADIVRAANQRLAPHQQIRRHTVWPDDSFPLTPTLKVKRADVAERLAQIDVRVGAKTAATT